MALANLGRLTEARIEFELMNQTAVKIDDTWFVGNNRAIDVIEIGRAMANGEMAFHSGQQEAAYAFLRQGVALEDRLAYDEPPGWMQPVRHALGALLLAGDQAAEAELVYRADLVRHPNNPWSLLGLQQSFERQNKSDEAAKISDQVRQAWCRADVIPAASCYCHPDTK